MKDFKLSEKRWRIVPGEFATKDFKDLLFELSFRKLSILVNQLFSERRQTMLFSATQTRKVEDLAKISLKKEPLYVGVDDNKETATVDGLEQVTQTSITKRSSLRTD